MANKLSLSIIMPVYNAADSLLKSVGSIFHQGLEANSFEVILVNDGSKDNSLEICKELAQKHNEIKVINKTNGGIADARNRGLEEANGEWIAFLDDDDYLLENGLSIAFEPYKDRKDVDLIRYGSDYDFWPIKPIMVGIESEGYCWDLIKEDKAYLPAFVWTHIYRRSFIKAHNIRFENVAMFDDYLFVSSAYLYNAYAIITRSTILRYVVHEGSGTTVRSKQSSRKVAHDSIIAYSKLCKLAKQTCAIKDKELWNKCLDVMNSRKRIGVTRMLSSDYSHKEFMDIRNLSKTTEFYPIRYHALSGIRGRFEVWCMNSIMSSWLFYKFSKIVMQHIIEPYILPKLRYMLR